LDKKTLPLIIFLVIVVIAYWPLLEYFGLAPEPKTDQGPAADSVQAVEPQDQEQAASIGTGSSAQVSSLDTPTPRETDTTLVDTIIVETNKYTVTLTSLGGGTVSLFLKDYTYRDGTPIEMMPEPIGATPDASFGGGTFSTSATHFVSNLPPGLYYANSGTFELEFAHTNAEGGQIMKKYTFHPDQYHFDLEMIVIGRETFGFERQYSLAWTNPIGIAEADASIDYDAMEAVIMRGGSRETLDDFKDDPTGEFAAEKLDQSVEGITAWAGVRNKYFAAVIIPLDRSAEGAFAKGSKKEIRIYEEDVTQRRITAGLKMEFANVSEFGDRFRVFVGPLDYMLMSDYGVDLEDMLGIGTTPVVGWIVKPFAIGVMWLLPKMYAVVPNYGLVIILFALFIKIITLPLSKKQFLSMQAMKELQPKIEELRKKHKKNPQQLNQETMKLYKKHGVNPLSGCLPMLPQMPLLFAMFSVIRSTVLLRSAHFVWFIDDLSRGARSFTDPYMLLVVFMVAAQFASQKLTMPATQQNKAMLYLMPLVMGYFFHTFAAGLVLYWTCFSVFSLLDWVLFKRKVQTHNVKTA
jgi:YidC/Oxa1 family membrane protein insertase